MSTANRSPNKRTKGAHMKLPSRLPTGSYATTMKRHASFDSPAEIPLPSPTPSSAGLSSTSIGSYPFPDVLKGSPQGRHKKGNESPASASTSSVDSIFSNASGKADTNTPPSSNEQSPPLPQPVLPHPRPYSVPDDMSPGSKQRPSMPHRSSTIKPLPSQSELHSRSQHTDRTSSASLPLPSHIPFSTLPRKQQHDHGRSIISRMTNATAVPLSSLPQRSSAPAAGPSRSNSARRRGAAFPSNSPFSAYDVSAHLARNATLHTSEPFLGSSDTPPINSNSTTTHSAVYRHANYPGPEPPQILDADDRPIGPVTPAVSDSSSSTVSAGTTASAPHVPFLSPLPAPNGTYLEVETRPAEYILHVRLPGFKRDAITLATKKRRILHVVADSWADASNSLASSPSQPSSASSSASSSPGDAPSRPPRPDDPSSIADPSRGGHFERRISFSYDADLLQVRAEFDGEMLRVFIPRRVSSNSYGNWP